MTNHRYIWRDGKKVFVETLASPLASSTGLIHLFTEPWLRPEQAPIVAALSFCDHGVDLKTDCDLCVDVLIAEANTHTSDCRCAVCLDAHLILSKE